MYILYGGDFTRSALVQWVLEEGGLEYELRTIDIFKGEHRASEFLAINPAGLVPVLITPEGQAYLRENEAAVQGVMARMKLSAEAMPGESAHAVREAIHTLRHAIGMQRRWTPGEAERVRGIIERAAREIVLGAPDGERKGE